MIDLLRKFFGLDSIRRKLKELIITREVNKPMKNSNSIKKYIQQIQENFDVEINEDNYQSIIKEAVDYPVTHVEYIEEYMEENNKSADFEWGCFFYLFLQYALRKDVYEIEKYHVKLMRYPTNFLVEINMAEMNMSYYGNIFKARDGYLKALEFIPEDPTCHHHLALVYYYLGIVDKSIEHNQMAIENAHNAYNPTEAKARSLYNIAVYYISVYEKYDEAKEMLNEALLEMPDYVQAKTLLKQLKAGALWKRN